MKKLNALIVNKESLMRHYFEMAFEKLRKDNLCFDLYQYETSELAIQNVNEMISSKANFDIVFISTKLIHLENKLTLEGKDLLMEIREKMSNTKMVILSPLPSHLIFYEVFKYFSPESLLVKDEIVSHSHFIKGIKQILNKGHYYTNSVSEFLKDKASKKLKLGHNDCKILYLLSIGVKIKNLCNYMNMSLSTIEKKKRNIQQLLDVNTTESLIRKAKQYKYIE